MSRARGPWSETLALVGEGIAAGDLARAHALACDYDAAAKASDQAAAAFRRALAAREARIAALLADPAAAAEPGAYP